MSTPIEISDASGNRCGAVIEMTPDHFRAIGADGRAFGGIHRSFAEAHKAVKQHAVALRLDAGMREAGIIPPGRG